MRPDRIGYFFRAIEETNTESGKNTLELKLERTPYSFKMRGIGEEAVKEYLVEGRVAALYYANPDDWRLHILEERRDSWLLEWWYKRKRARAQ